MGYRYIGAKTQIIDPVLAQIGKIVGNKAVVADIMCGTATVSSALKAAGHTVIANDLMTYSYHHARVQLHLKKYPSFSGLREFMSELSHTQMSGSLFPLSPYEKVLHVLNGAPLSEEGYFWREFSPAGQPSNGERPRNYFTAENAAKIDGLRKTIRRFKDEKLITALEYSLLVHDLVMAANDIANIAGTYGHYLSKTVGRAKSAITLKPSAINTLNSGAHHKVYQGYAENVASRVACDLCYIDPPYMKRQYAANYHILETLARGDEPEAIGVSGLRPWRDQYSNFCTKTKIRDSFDKIVTRMECPNFLVSYSEDGLLTLDELRDTLSRHGSVAVTTIPNKRFKSNNSELAPVLTEYLIHLAKH